MGWLAAPGSREHVDVVGDACFSSARRWLRLKSPSQRRFHRVGGFPGLLLQGLAEGFALRLATLPFLDAGRRGNGIRGPQRFHGYSPTRSFRRRRSIARLRIWLMRDSVTPRISPISFR